jgi:DNA-binding NarL/FixJ family response regulator
MDSSVAGRPGDSGRKIKVVIVEDHPMFRERIAHLIEQEGDMQVSGVAGSIGPALEIIQKTNPDVAIVDITLKGSSGIELIKNLKAQEIEVPVLVLSMHDESLYAERVLRAGGKGYITKDVASEQVMEAIRCVLAGGVYLSKDLTAKVLKNLSGTRLPVDTSTLERLSDRELEVLHLIGVGRSTREIAETLSLGVTTVDTYRTRIKEKLHLKNATELQRYAAEWTRCEPC